MQDRHGSRNRVSVLAPHAGAAKPLKSRGGLKPTEKRTPRNVIIAKKARVRRGAGTVHLLATASRTVCGKVVEAISDSGQLRSGGSHPWRFYHGPCSCPACLRGGAS